MKVVLTGATGFIGSHVLADLYKHGHEVTALVRDDAQADAVAARGATPAVVDLYDRPTVARLLGNADAAIHTASPGDATSANLDSTVVDAVIDAFDGTGKTYLQISGLWIYGANPSITEASAFNAPALVSWKEPIERRVLGTPGMRGVVIVSGTAYRVSARQLPQVKAPRRPYRPSWTSGRWSWPRTVLGWQVGTDLQLADTDILLADQTDEPAVRGRDRRAFQVAVDHDATHLRDAHERPVRARSGTHGPLDEQIRIPLELSSPQQPQYHPLPAHDHAGIPSGGNSPVSDLAEPLAGRAHRHIPPHHIGKARVLRVRTLGRQACSHPVLLSRPVVVHLGEPEGLEPARGSRAEVSTRVRAVHDDRPAGIERPGGLGLDPAQREVDRSGQVVFAVFPGRQHVDDLGTPLHQAANSLAIDVLGHRCLLIPGTA